MRRLLLGGATDLGFVAEHGIDRVRIIPTTDEGLHRCPLVGLLLSLGSTSKFGSNLGFCSGAQPPAAGYVDS